MVTLKCSRCGQDLEDTLIKLENNITVYKISDTGVMIPYHNLEEPTSEFLCPECFEKYCDCLDELNKEYDGRYLVNLVEVIDDVQYDNPS